MRRRDLIALMGGAAIAWPLATRAQQKAMPVIGWLGVTTPEAEAPLLADVRAGLADVGYVEGQNLAIEYRWAESHNDRMPALAAELVARKVDVITTGGVPGTRAAMGATSTIPILTVVGVDPVATGLVNNLAHPDGNLTGFTVFGPRTNIKRFELLSQLVPQARVMAVLINPTNPASASLKSAEQSVVYGPARAKGIELHLVKTGTPDEIDAAFATLAELHAEGLMPGVDPFFYQRKDQIVALAARYRIATIYDHRQYTDAGGLISYGAKGGETLRPLGVYAGRLLAGAKPADLPFQMPTRFELVINRKTANALGLTIPLELETLADEIIE
jgi:putative ABC transport system substrate-binding protein